MVLCRSEKERAIYRIKRAVLKNSYEEGGLNIPDLECLNRSLKLRQFIRANKCSHPVSRIQTLCLEKIGYSSKIAQEYYKISEGEEIVRSAMTTINTLCDYTRNIIIQSNDDACEDSLSIA